MNWKSSMESGLRRAVAGLVFGLTLVALTLPPEAAARDLFVSRISVLGLTSGQSTNRLQNVADFYTQDNLEDLFPGVDTNDLLTDANVAAELDLRGLKAFLIFEAAETKLKLRIPGVLNAEFDGGSRDASIEELEDWLTGVADQLEAGELANLLNALVRESPVDPVAGNPNSLQTRMLMADWGMALRGPMLGGDLPTDHVPNLFGISAGAGYYRACDDGCMDVTTIDIPLNWDINLDNGKFSILTDLPVTATFTEGRWAAMISIGLGAKWHISDWWNVSFTARGGGVGSVDVGALAILYSFSFLNHMEWDVAGLRVGMGNQLTISNSVDDFEIDDTRIAYDISSQILRNGGYVAGSMGELWGKAVGWEVYGSWSHFFGTDLYMEDSGEAGAALTLLGDIGGRPYDFVRLSLGYMGGTDYNGLNGGLHFRF